MMAPSREPALMLRTGFVDDPDALFTALKTGVAWDERMKARKTASFGVSYDYSQIAYEEAPMPALLEALCVRLEGELGFKPNNCLLNYYPDGKSSMGFHSDETDGLADGTGVAIVSLGSVRTIATAANWTRRCGSIIRCRTVRSCTCRARYSRNGCTRFPRTRRLASASA